MKQYKNVFKKSSPEIYKSYEKIKKPKVVGEARKEGIKKVAKDTAIDLALSLVPIGKGIKYGKKALNTIQKMKKRGK